MTSQEIVQRRLRCQALVGPPLPSAVQVVRRLTAVQAQDYPGAKWALGQRAKGLRDGDVDRLLDEGAILRTHVLRPTWHFVLPEDIRWLLALTAPRVKAATAYYLRLVELDPRTLRRSFAVLARALEGGKRLTRAELSSALARAGIEARGQRLGHLMLEAELDQVVVSGGLRGKQLTYALFDERVPPAPALDGEQALATITRRYLAGHGPAQAQDISWWSGLTLAQVKAGLTLAAPDLERAEVEGTTYWWAGETAGAAPARRRSPPRPRSTGRPFVHLLPNYDELLIAFKDRRHAGEARLLHAPGVDQSFQAHFVLLDGKLVGGWRRTLARERLTVTTRLLTPLDRPQRAALEAARARYQRFLGLPVALTDESGPPARPSNRRVIRLTTSGPEPRRSRRG